MRRHRAPARALLPALALLAPLPLAGAPASATWSIILIDTRTGEIAVGSATCLASFDLRAGTPVLIPGVGAATAQSFVDSTGQNRVLIRDRLAQGLSPQDILAQLATFDSGHQTRQYGIADTRGQTLTFSGTSAGAWAGGLTGQFVSTHAGHAATIVYAIQGNVLTGQPVVDQAVAAAINTPGDLAAKLMASMQAARLMGGDGRCSCSSGNPTGCGSPPATFTKSAHIAYMLIGRAGDREGGNGAYRAGPAPLAIAVGDVTGDGRPDLLVANTSGTTVSLLANTTPPRRALPFTGPLIPTFGPLPTTITTGSGPRDLVIADVTGDGLPDLISADSGSHTVSVCRALPSPPAPPGAFAAPVAYGVSISPRALAVADLDGQPGPDIAVANLSAASVSIRFNDGAGAFPTSALIPVDSTPVGLVAANLVGSPAADLAVACRGTSRIVILAGDGAGGFAPATTITTLGGLTALAAADLDGDGDTDLAASFDTAQSIQVYLNTAGAFSATTHAAGFTAADILAGDVNSAGGPDLVATGSSRFAVFLNSGAGAFTLNRTYTVASNIVGGALADLDGDGDPDLASASNTFNSAATIRNYGPGPLAGTFNDGVGCGTGDYYMNFNIAFQSTASPDPVLQLQSLYDLWRAGLAGRPDAVRSQVTLAPPYLPADGAATATMTITLRDWQGNSITVPITSVEVAHAPASAGSCAIGPAIDQGNGVYTIQVTAGSTAGLDRFQITARDAARPVTLMPDPALALHPAGCYANCDHSTTPPILNVQDFSCFLTRYAAADPYANCDQSTQPPALNVQDFGCFLTRYAAGCP